MNADILAELAQLRAEVAEMRRERVTYRNVKVTAIDEVTNTFTAAPTVDEDETLAVDEMSGIAAPPQFLPAVGDQVRLTLAGAVPLFEPSRLNSASGTVTVNGLEVIDEDPVFGGRPLTEILEPKGDTVPYWGQSEADGPTTTSTETGYREVIVTLKKGYRYAIHSSGFRVDASTTGQQFWVNIRYTTADGEAVPTTPTVTDQIVTRQPANTLSSNSVGHTGAMSGMFLTPAGDGPVTYRFLITLSRVIGSGSAFIRANNVGDANSIWFTDHGRQTDQTLAVNAGSGGVVASAPKEYVTTVNSVWGATWYGNGVKRTGANYRYQGAGGGPTAGNQYSALGFPTSLATTLAGATVTKVRVYLNATWWYYDDGGDAIIGVHGYTSEPASLSFYDYDVVRKSWFSQTGAKWITLPTTHYAGWADGTFRGIVIGPGLSSSLLYYGHFQAGGATKIEVTYER